MLARLQIKLGVAIIFYLIGLYVMTTMAHDDNANNNNNNNYNVLTTDVVFGNRVSL